MYDSGEPIAGACAKLVTCMVGSRSPLTDEDIRRFCIPTAALLNLELSLSAAIASWGSVRAVRSRRPGHSRQRRTFLSLRHVLRSSACQWTLRVYNRRLLHNDFTPRRGLRTTQTLCYVRWGYRRLLASGFALPWFVRCRRQSPADVEPYVHRRIAIVPILTPAIRTLIGL